MKKVICFPFIGDSFGGSHQSSLVIIKSLKKKGFNPVIILHKKGTLETILKKKGIDFHFFPLNNFFGSSNNKHLNLIYLILSTPTICYLILKYKIDIIHSNDMKIHLNWILPSFLLRKRFIWHQRTIFPNSRISKMLIKLAYAIVSISKFVQKTIPTSLHQKNVLIYNSLDLNNKNLSFKKKKMILRKKSQKLIGFFGNIQKIKQPYLLLEIAEIIKKNKKNIKICCFGNDKENLLNNLKSQIDFKNLYNYIEFFDFVYPVEPIMNDMDIIIATSLNDGFGRTIIEGMKLKKPVIASNAGGHNEIIKNNQNGILVDSRDPKKFYLGIIKILNNKKFKKKLVRNASEDCKIFSVQSINSHLIRLYE